MHLMLIISNVSFCLEPVQKKKNRGIVRIPSRQKRHLKLVGWNHYSVVSIGSNLHGVNSLLKAKRWSNAEKKIIEVDQPNMI